MMELSLSVRNWKCYAIQSQCLPAATKAERHRRKWYHRLHGSVQFSHSVMSDSLQPHGLQHSRLPFPSPTPRACSNSCLSSWWCHPPSYPLSSPSPPAFSLSQHQGLFQWVSSLYQVAKVLDLQLKHQSFQWIFGNWFLLGLTGLISLQSKGLYSNTVQKHQLAQLSLWSSSHIHTWLLTKP